MDNYRTRRIISIAVVAIIIGVALFGLVFFGNLLFFSSGNNVFTKIDTHQSDLLSTSAGRAVKVDIRGPIVADEKFHSYQIRITPNNRTLTIYGGYLKSVANNELLGNNVQSYNQFVNALNQAKLMNSSEFTGMANNTDGVCATGFLYQFTILNSNKQVKQLWATSCGNATGSLGRNYNPLLNLFIVQIPDGLTKTSGIWQ